MNFRLRRHILCTRIVVAKHMLEMISTTHEATSDFRSVERAKLLLKAHTRSFSVKFFSAHRRLLLIQTRPYDYIEVSEKKA